MAEGCGGSGRRHGVVGGGHGGGCGGSGHRHGVVGGGHGRGLWR